MGLPTSSLQGFVGGGVVVRLPDRYVLALCGELEPHRWPQCGHGMCAAQQVQRVSCCA